MVVVDTWVEFECEVGLDVGIMDSNRGLELGKGIGRVRRESSSNSDDRHHGACWETGRGVGGLHRKVSYPLVLKKKTNDTIGLQSKPMYGIKHAI